MTRLKRPLNPMPDLIHAAPVERGLTTAYEVRPDYQKNDYLGWIARTKRPDTRQKRLDQMLDELQRGGVYMNMVWRG
ncbi:hypothetical protein B5V01_31755 [Mesorhizobium erdmanii]|uniref:YdeI/OmpD-associated family protein n=2 Tax=Mesorhizobium TaxID=68287 RepID=A0A3M9XEE8_9HYPH|nr:MULTISPECIES: YdeI/OmpD-associated family protein [Mesorhizobium]RNJ46427.1 hypothetical protein DNR46_00460 [Mesorhizobium japonicum]RXT34939.1 hypothetical protein B5V01_31755 [Mesorhizobium erdmanii]